VTSEADTLAALTARIRAELPDLQFTNAVLNDYGEDNQVVVADDAWIVRFPRPDNFGRFGAELNLLDEFSKVSLVRVPDYEHVTRDRTFGAYRMIGGVELTPPRFAALRPDVQRNVLADLAGFLSALHALPMQTIAQADGHIERCWSGEQFAALYRGMRRAKIARKVDDAWLARFDAFHAAFERVTQGVPRLAHGDLSDDHILVAEDGYLSGVIDFTDAAWGDPAIDFAYFWRLGEPVVDHVLTLYTLTPQDPGLKTRAHWTFVRYLINQLWYGERAKWNLTVNEALAELDGHLRVLGF
jgi:aminoglycoside 2''-phosphotransferase